MNTQQMLLSIQYPHFPILISYENAKIIEDEFSAKYRNSYIHWFTMINYEVQSNPLQIFVNLHPQNPIIIEKTNLMKILLKCTKQFP